MATFSTVTTADGATLEYLVSGPAGGPVLLFLPGTPNAAVCFRCVVEPAAELGLRTVSRQDRMAPFEHGQWLAAKVPDAQAHLFATEGHLSMTSHIPQVLAESLRRFG